MNLENIIFYKKILSLETCYKHNFFQQGKVSIDQTEYGLEKSRKISHVIRALFTVLPVLIYGFRDILRESRGYKAITKITVWLFFSFSSSADK